MRATVLRDPRLSRRAGRFVWLEIDGEKERNAGYLEKFPAQVYPTLVVLDPATERPVLSWAGSATLSQLERLLDEATRSMRKAATGADAILARADAAQASGDFAGAAKLQAEALAAGGAAWPGRGRAAETRVVLLSTDDESACAHEADRLLPTLPHGPSWANVAVTGLQCAQELKPEDPDRAALAGRLERAARAALVIPGLLPIDALGIHQVLYDVRKSAGDEAGARVAAEAWWREVQRARRKAKDARDRAAYVSHLAAAATARGRPADALPGLAADERAVPDDYDPPYRAARVLQALGRVDEALAAADRALAHAYGPRRVRIQELRATLQEARGDRRAAADTVRAALEEEGRIPPAQRRGGDRALRERLQKKLDALDGKAA